MTLIILSLSASILCIAIAVIIRMREKQTAVGVRRKDFIELAIERKRAALAANPWGMSLKVYVAISAAGAVLGGGAAYLATQNMILSFALFVIGLFLPELIEAIRENRERSKFEERYARALRQISSSLKSGMSIHQAISDICTNPFIHDSIRNEFKQLDSDMKVGISVQEGFERFARRVNSDDATDVAIAITMQNEVGGNNVLVVETIARDINTRIMARKETKSLFAGTSSTISMMDIVPMAIIAFISVSSPAYIAPFFETPMMKLVFWGLIGFTLVGSYVIRRQVRKMKEDCGV